MDDIIHLIQVRHSTRIPFDCQRKVPPEDLQQILEAARWAPTAHNMQNFEIIVVDDQEILRRINEIPAPVSEAFVRENYEQLSFSEEELRRKKVGILARTFPPSWIVAEEERDMAAIQRERAERQSTNDTPLLLILAYDTRKRAPASAGDVLGIMSLGCVLENMWLVAQSLGIGFQILSAFSGKPTATEVKRILAMPDYLRIAFNCRLGYARAAPDHYLRVRREIEDFVYHNRYGDKLASITGREIATPAQSARRRAPTYPAIH